MVPTLKRVYSGIRVNYQVHFKSYCVTNGSIGFIVKRRVVGWDLASVHHLLKREEANFIRDQAAVVLNLKSFK